MIKLKCDCASCKTRLNEDFDRIIRCNYTEQEIFDVVQNAASNMVERVKNYCYIEKDLEDGA